MQLLAETLEKTINQYLEPLKKMPEEEMALKLSPSKWSKKEIIGHLIDSAQSNIRRFVIAQYEDTPAITYNQDKWVAIVNYQQWKINDLINLWYFLNKQVCEILKNTSPEAAQRQCRTEALHPIEWLAADYVKHLRHHIHQVLDLELLHYP